MKPDPKFPDRPQTAVFDLLSKLANNQDNTGKLEAFLSDDELLAVDYIGKNRTQFAIKAVTEAKGEAELRLLVMLGQVNVIDLCRMVYVDAFVLGKQYGEEA